MSRCLELLQNAVKDNNAEPWCFAYLKDRTLTTEGKAQIYGTQFDVIDGQIVPFPIETPKIVNKLRKNLGLDSIEEAAQRIKERYKVEANS